MTRVLFYAKLVDSQRLHDEIKAVIGARVEGVRYAHPVGSPEGCEIVVDDAATPADETTVASLVAAHDPAPPVDQLLAAWQTIMTQVGARPLENMDVTQMTAWVNANITDPATRTALIAIGKELFVTRAEMRLVKRALMYLFNQS